MGESDRSNLIPFPGWQGLGFALGIHLKQMGPHPGEFSFEDFNEANSLAEVIEVGTTKFSYDARCGKIIDDFAERGRVKEAG